MEYIVLILMVDAHCLIGQQTSICECLWIGSDWYHEYFSGLICILVFHSPLFAKECSLMCSYVLFNILDHYGLMLCSFWSNHIGQYMLEMLCLPFVILAQILAWWPSGPRHSPFHLSQKTQTLMQYQSPRLTSQPSMKVCFVVHHITELINSCVVWFRHLQIIW